jgi:hypothetical protein
MLFCGEMGNALGDGGIFLKVNNHTFEQKNDQN